ncbi:neuronal acetylcholine receptor subunit alpha-3-like [Haliotis rufescens]|uniref:neuronal acetylcholine receptor subunit alpha-3-like n=1 Tax=Haliotis rufescens TaxID=6454 RepID=UPI00201ECCFB|nr:neuronal acetylcholine receptor subunit alpha-3-like [Haliotis rufescens]
MASNISLHTYSRTGVSLGKTSENGEFEFTNHWVEHSSFLLKRFENEAIDELHFFVILKRRRAFYWLCLVSPLLVFPLLSPLSFLVPADSGEKTALAITSLLSIFVFMSSIYETLPKLSNTISLFVVLASVQTFLSFLTVICKVTILCINRLPSNYTIPMCLKKVFIMEAPTAKILIAKKGSMLNANLDGETVHAPTGWQDHLIFPYEIESLHKVDRRPTMYRALVVTILILCFSDTDEFLVWNQTDYGGIRYITVPENKIWKPDYVIDNDVSAKKGIGDERKLVIIDSRGQILWEPGYIATTTCNVDIKYFPFDTQICSVKLTPWMTSNISIHSYSKTGVSLGDTSENGEFEIINHWVEHSPFPMTGFENEALDELHFFVVLKRRTTFYWLCLVSPLLVFPLLSPLSFLVPAGSGEKTTLAITSLLSIFVFMSSIYETLPKLSNTISLFVLLASVQTFISFLTVTCNVIILCIHRLPSNYKIPMCLKRAFKRNSQTAKAFVANDGSMLSANLDEENVHASGDNATWEMVAGFINTICFIVSFVSTTVVTIVIGAMLFS